MASVRRGDGGAGSAQHADPSGAERRKGQRGRHRQPLRRITTSLRRPPRAVGRRLWSLGPGAVANADLSFITRKEAERAPTRIRNQNLIDVATGIVAARRVVDAETAVARLRDAASRAGV